MKSYEGDFKKVLIITTHFVPDIHVGAKRMTKFAKYLPLYGWQPVILTKEVSEYHGVDESLVEELPSDLPIHRVRRWRFAGQKPSPMVQATQPLRKKGVQNARCLRHLLTRVANVFMFYNYFWFLPAFFSARNLLSIEKNDGNNIKIVFSSGPDWEAHLVGLLLKLALRVIWVCEFRDPWARFPNIYRRHMSILRPPCDKFLEKWVLAQADKLVFVGERLRDWILRGEDSPYHYKAAIVYNGYDEDDFAGVTNMVVPSNNRFTIVYTGTWVVWRTPLTFLRAIGQLIRIYPDIRSHIAVHLVGEVKFDPDLERRIPVWIQEEGLQEVVVTKPFVTHREAIMHMRQGHILLLVQSQVDNPPRYAEVSISAKIFEYLRIQRPILALVPREGDAARIIDDLNAGVVVSPNDVDQIAQKIYELYLLFKRGQLRFFVRLEQIEKFDRRRQTGELAGIFDSLVTDIGRYRDKQ